MPGHSVDTETLEGVSLEGLDAGLFQEPVPKEDWTRKRKTKPLNTALPSTWLWANGLPPEVRPLALMDSFPRIANLLAASWKDPVAFHTYMRDLLVDRRGGRRGFPPDIRQELIRLRTAYGLRRFDRV